MQFPPSDHMFWKVILLLIVGAVYCFMSTFNYENGFVIKDLGTLIAMWSAMVGFNMAKTQVLKEKEEPQS
jgi:hypothetical protein